MNITKDKRYEIKSRLLIKHTKNCAALKHYKEGLWITPWWSPNKTIYRDSIGRHTQHGSRSWTVFECNSTECDAELIVLTDSILNFVTKELENKDV